MSLCQDCETGQYGWICPKHMVGNPTAGMGLLQPQPNWWDQEVNE